jgi:putative MATE family efflux protein
MDVPEVLKGYAVPLMRIYSLGLVFAYILINTNGIMRACGEIKKSLITMAVVCLLNTFLNFYLAFRTPLGYQGIAVATVLSTFIGCLMNIFFLRSLLSGFFKFSAASVKKIINIGWPAGLLQIFWQLAAIALFLILARLPKNNIEVMAAFTNGLKIESAIFLPAFAFNMANAVVVGNLLGKKDRENAFSAGLVTALLGVAAVSLLTLIIISNAGPIAAMLSNNPTVISESINYIRIALLFEPVMAWSVILAGALNGAGDTKSVMIIVTLCVWAVRVPLSYFLALYFGLGASAVWWSMNLSIIAQAIFISRRYFSRAWFHHSEKITAY